MLKNKWIHSGFFFFFLIIIRVRRVTHLVLQHWFSIRATRKVQLVVAKYCYVCVILEIYLVKTPISAVFMWLYYYSDAMNFSLKKGATILVDIVWHVARCMGCLVLPLGVPSVWTVGFIIAYTAFQTLRWVRQVFVHARSQQCVECNAHQQHHVALHHLTPGAHTRGKRRLCGLNMSIQGENVNRFLLFRRLDVHPWWRLAQEGLESRPGCHILPLYVDILSDCFILSAVLSPQPIYSN